MKIGCRKIGTESYTMIKRQKSIGHGAASFEFDYDLYGTGPVGESQVWATIQWDSLKKAK